MITYVTGNKGKYYSVKEKFEENNLTCNFFKYDLEEPNVNDINFISYEKARLAYSLVSSPVFVADSGFFIEDYPGNPGYPGAFVKRSGISSDIVQLLTTLKDTTNRNAYFKDILTFYDGIEYYQFESISKGIISREILGDNMRKAKSNLWLVFIPEGYTKTLAEMSDEEMKLRSSKIESSTKKFIKWYKNTYPLLRKVN